MRARINRVVIEIVQDDTLAQPVAGIVVQSGADLRLPPEVAARAGSDVQRQIASLGTVEAGSAVMVGGGGLGVRKLLLAITPQWGEGGERTKLAGATYECLYLAETHGLESIAFPPLSPSGLGYAIENCATTMLSQIVDYTFEDLEHLRAVTICLADAVAFDTFEHELLTQIDDLRRSGEGTVQA